MPDCDDLLLQARENPESLRFDEVCALAECHGFVLARQRGSHRVFKKTGCLQLLNFQPDNNGMAKRYQIKQLLLAIDETPSQDSD